MRIWLLAAAASAALAIVASFLPVISLDAPGLHIGQTAWQRWWFLPGALAATLLGQLAVHMRWPGRMPALALLFTCCALTGTAGAVLLHTMTTSTICTGRICQLVPAGVSITSGVGAYLLLVAAVMSTWCLALAVRTKRTKRTKRTLQTLRTKKSPEISDTPADYHELSEEGSTP